MNALFNTTFFYDASISAPLREFLATRWLRACEVSGCGRPLCLKMASEEGIERLAVQTPFPTLAEAERFGAEIVPDMADELTRLFGPEKFTCFSTLMEEIAL